MPPNTLFKATAPLPAGRRVSTRARRLHRDPDTFKEQALAFEVKKPASWRFLPASWSPTALLKRAPDFKDTLVRNAALPFCCAQGNHESRVHALPTFQACARGALIHTPGLASTVLQSLISAIQGIHPTYELIEASSRFEIAGCKAIYLRGAFSLITEPDGEPIEISCVSRSYVVFGPRATFTLGLSSSSDPAYFSEVEFEHILRSLHISA